MIPRVELAPTPRTSVFAEGSARLLHFAPTQVGAGIPVLLVPSMINRWYVLDLRRGASLVEALCQRGFEVYCLDWGEPGDEDRYLEWASIIDRIGRAVRRISRRHGCAPGLLGYCMGATVSAIYAALEPASIRAFVNLAGPIDFSHAGMLGDLVDARWFDPDAIAAAGNMSAPQMQAGFVTLRPTLSVAKWVGYAAISADPQRSEAFWSLEAWASDNVAFPAAAYVRYIRDLYQRNELVRGEHTIRGRPARLSAIECPVLVAVASRDTICPPAAATALCDHASSADTSVVEVAGGHVGAVIGSKARTVLYPAVSRFFEEKRCNSTN